MTAAKTSNASASERRSDYHLRDAATHQSEKPLDSLRKIVRQPAEAASVKEHPHFQSHRPYFAGYDFEYLFREL